MSFPILYGNSSIITSIKLQMDLEMDNIGVHYLDFDNSMIKKGKQIGMSKQR